jgi:prolyl-tRNA synthetase
MRMSHLFGQTLREVSSEAGPPGYQLLLRAGFVRPLAPGGFGFLPLGEKTRRHIAGLAAEALKRLGGQPLSLPAVQPVEVLGDEPSGEMEGGRPIRFRDHSRREMALGSGQLWSLLTLAHSVVQSYRQLPLLLYHIWEPFRDDVRAGGGLFGSREARVLDGYTLAGSADELAAAYEAIARAFADVCRKCGLDVIMPVTRLEARGDAAGHSVAWVTSAGEECIIQCSACGYVATQPVARTRKSPPPAEEPGPLSEVETPDCKTIADLAAFLEVPKSRTAKAMFMVAYIEGQGDRPVIAMVRGDGDLNEEKLKRALGAKTVGPATEAEIRLMGAEPGYGSPLHVSKVTVVVDELIPVSPNLVSGANRPGYHALNVNIPRDYRADVVADITLARENDPCPECGAALTAHTAIELASLTHLGDAASRGLDATVLDREGHPQPLWAARYRLHVDRLLAAVAETDYDEHGLVWPVAIAPYHVYLMTLGKRSETVEHAADRLWTELTSAGVAVLYDDRDERAGVKFNDADLIGLPVRVAVGERGLKDGVVECKLRRGGELETVRLEELAARVSDLLRVDNDSH